MAVLISHSWAENAAACSARRFQLVTTTEWNCAKAKRESVTLLALDRIGPGLPKRLQMLPIGGRKIGDGKRKVDVLQAARLINEISGWAL